MVKKCSDKYKYGCKLLVECDNQEEITKYFRLVKTHTGDYHLNICRQCENRRARDMRKKNYKLYNYRKKTNKTYDERDFGTMMTEYLP